MFNPASCAFCDKLFTIPMGGVISAYGPVCNGCKERSLTETDSSHEIEADRPDPTESYGFDEDWQDTMKSDSAFDRAFALLKMPFVNREGQLAADVLYQGRRTGDKDSNYWTPHKDKAMAYAMFGPRYDSKGSPFVDANEHYPELYMATAPKEYIDVDPDDEYMGRGEGGAVERGRVAFHDPVIGQYAEKLPDEHIAQIIENIINSDLYDDEMYEEQIYMDDAEPWEYNLEWDRIFNNKGKGRSINDTLRPVDDGGPIQEALEEAYGSEEPVWDLVTTNQTHRGTPHDFVRRLRERGQ